MLSPEVWNFSSPASTAFCRQYQTQENLNEFVEQQYFNHYISVILPNNLSAPEELKNILNNDSDFYKVEKIPAAQFFQKDFIDLFVRKGQLTAISVKGHSDRKDQLRCTPDGKVILSLSKETYLELGLSVNNVLPKSTSTSYCLSFDFKSKWNNLEKNLKHIKTKLKQHEKVLTFDMLILWEPEDSKICPSSIALYFAKKNFVLKTCSIQSESRCEYNVTVPTHTSLSDCSDFVEWLGAFGLQCKIDLDNYLSTFKCPEESTKLGQVSFLSSSGFLSTNRIKKIVSTIRDHINVDSRSRWIAVVVQAFRNTIFHKKNNQFFDGDQHYCLIFKKDSPVLVYSYATGVR